MLSLTVLLITFKTKKSRRVAELLLLLLLLIFVCSHMGFSTLNYKIIRNMYI